jgi:catechol 2,3-dioxygenase
LYLRDPDDNGVELYWDRPKQLWPRTPAGQLAMYTRRLDVASLLREVQSSAVPREPVGPGPLDLA